MRVFLVDDHSLLRSGVANLLRAHGHEVVGEAEDGMTALQTIPAANPDVVLMDIRMPEMSGLETVRRLKEISPDTKVVMLTVSDDEPDLFDAIKSNAEGYVLKDASGEELSNAIEAVTRGESVVPLRMTGSLFSEFQTQASMLVDVGLDPLLSSAEWDVVVRISQGLTNEEIADQVSLDEQALDRRIQGVLKKLELNDPKELASWFMKNQVTRQGQVTVG